MMARRDRQSGSAIMTGGTTRTSALVCAVASVLLVISCGGGGTNNPAAPTSTSPEQTTASQAALFKGISASSTGDAQFPAVAVHEQGDQLAVVSETNVLEATFRRLNGDAVTVRLGQQGLPESATFGDAVALFDNYTESTVDIAIVPEAGQTQVLRSVPVDPALLSTVRSLFGKLSGPVAVSRTFQPRITAENWVLALKWAGAVVKVASCAISIAHGAIPLAAYACSNAIVDVLYLVTDTDTPLLMQSAGAIVNTVFCLDRRVLSCVQLAITGARTAIELSESIRRSRREAIEDARKGMSH